MEARIERLESQVEAIRAEIAQLHNASMAFVTETFAAMERRLTERAETNTRRIEEQIGKLGERTARVEVRAGLVGLVGGAVPTFAALALAWLTGHLR